MTDIILSTGKNGKYKVEVKGHKLRKSFSSINAASHAAEDYLNKLKENK
jgi:hypothetical protein